MRFESNCWAGALPAQKARSPPRCRRAPASSAPATSLRPEAGAPHLAAAACKYSSIFAHNSPPAVSGCYGLRDAATRGRPSEPAQTASVAGRKLSGEPSHFLAKNACTIALPLERVAALVKSAAFLALLTAALACALVLARAITRPMALRVAIVFSSPIVLLSFRCCFSLMCSCLFRPSLPQSSPVSRIPQQESRRLVFLRHFRPWPLDRAWCLSCSRGQRTC